MKNNHRLLTTHNFKKAYCNKFTFSNLKLGFRVLSDVDLMLSCNRKSLLNLSLIVFNAPITLRGYFQREKKNTKVYLIFNKYAVELPTKDATVATT